MHPEAKRHVPASEYALKDDDHDELIYTECEVQEEEESVVESNDEEPPECPYEEPAAASQKRDIQIPFQREGFVHKKIDFTNQRSILKGLNVQSPWNFNYLENLTP